MRNTLRFIVVLTAFSLAACAGQANAPLPAQPGTGAHGGARVSLRMVIAAPHRHRVRGRSPKFVSPSTNGVLVSVYAHGAERIPANLIASTVTDVSSGSAACGGHSGFPRTCTAALFVRPTGSSNDDIIVASYDQAPSVGIIPPSAHLLGLGSLLNQAITPGAANQLQVFLGGVITSITGVPASVVMPSDGAAHQVTLVIDPQDFGNNTITAGSSDPYANPIVVKANESGGSGHVSFSLNGGTAQSQVTITESTDSVTVDYDGKSPLGYGASVSLVAPQVDGSNTVTETMNVTTLALAVSNGDYSPGSLALKGNGDELTVSVAESNSNSPTYTAVPSNCGQIADSTSVAQIGNSGSFVVYARPISSASGCTITVSDGGTSQIVVAVSNTYTGSEGTPTVALSNVTGLNAASRAEKIVVGPDGAMWFDAQCDKALYRVAATSNPTTAKYTLSTTPAAPTLTGLTAGPDGNLWYSASNSLVGVFSTSNDGSTNYSAQSTTNPSGIAWGADGALWFSESANSSADAIGRITTAGVVTNNYTTGIPNPSDINGMDAGPGGTLWFGSTCSADTFSIATTGGSPGTVTTYTGGAYYKFTTGPDGALWIAEGSAIGRMDPTTHVITSYSSPITGGNLEGLTVGPDGAIWFTEGAQHSSTNYIGRIDPSTHTITEPISFTGASVTPFGISAGPDGAIWFTEASGNQIGRISISSTPALRHIHKKR